MKKTVPAYVETTCDRCQNTIKDGLGLTAKVQYSDRCAASGDVGGYGQEIDLCTTCRGTFVIF